MKTRFVVILLFTLGACAKKAASPPASDQQDGTFQPEASGSQWTYQVSENLNPSSSLVLQAAESSLGITIPTIDTTYTMTLTAGTKDSVMGGMTYTVLATDSSAYDVYTSVQDTDYYSIGIIPAFNLTSGVSTASGGEAPVLYLKDQPAGTTWTQTMIAQGDTTVYTMTIVSVNGTKVVNGTTYTGVLEETVVVTPGGLSSIPGASGYDLSLTADYYFSRGTGLIEADMNSILFGLTYSETLQSASIQ